MLSVVEGDDVSDFLKNKEEFKPQRYEGDIKQNWDVVINREPIAFKLSSNPDDEEIGEINSDLGLPVSQDVVFSRRRSVVDNVLLRNDVDEVSELIEPGEVSPTYSRVEGTAGGQAVYFFAVWALFTILISSFALVGYTIVKSVRHSRKKPANMPELEAEGVETTVEAVEGGEISEEQPGPSNVVIEIDSPSSTESDKSDEIKSSPDSTEDYQTVTIVGETQL